jgi:excisionase family DNA binding protein
MHAPLGHFLPHGHRSKGACGDDWSTTLARGGARVTTGGHRDTNHDVLWDLDLLTADDVCALLKVKKSWLYDTVEAGAIEVIRLGKQLRFQPSAISAYLAARAQRQKSA